MICPECQENRYHYHSNLRPIEREKPMNIVEEAIGEFNGCWSGTSEKYVRAAITFAVRKCVEVVESETFKGSNLSLEILRAAGLEKQSRSEPSGGSYSPHG